MKMSCMHRTFVHDIATLSTMFKEDIGSTVDGQFHSNCWFSDENWKSVGLKGVAQADSQFSKGPLYDWRLCVMVLLCHIRQSFDSLHFLSLPSLVMGLRCVAFLAWTAQTHSGMFIALYLNFSFWSADILNTQPPTDITLKSIDLCCQTVCFCLRYWPVLSVCMFCLRLDYLGQAPPDHVIPPAEDIYVYSPLGTAFKVQGKDGASKNPSIITMYVSCIFTHYILVWICGFHKASGPFFYVSTHGDLTSMPYYKQLW